MKQRRNDDHLSVLAELYEIGGVAADQLPYTEAFETLYQQWHHRTGCSLTQAEFWRYVANARKRGRLPRLSR